MRDDVKRTDSTEIHADIERGAMLLQYVLASDHLAEMQKKDAEIEKFRGFWKHEAELRQDTERKVRLLVPGSQEHDCLLEMASQQAETLAARDLEIKGLKVMDLAADEIITAQAQVIEKLKEQRNEYIKAAHEEMSYRREPIGSADRWIEEADAALTKQPEPAKEIP